MKFHRHTTNGRTPNQQKASNVEIGLMRPLSIIVAVDEMGGFGKNGKIPWNFPEDMKHFQAITKGVTCVMGRKTYDDMYGMAVAKKAKGSKKERKKPVVIEEILPGRESFVVTRRTGGLQGATIVPGIRKAVESATKNKIFILGGEMMYKQAMPWVNTVHMTIIRDDYRCDRFFPVDYVHKHFRIINGLDEGNLQFVTYKRIR